MKKRNSMIRFGLGSWILWLVLCALALRNGGTIGGDLALELSNVVGITSLFEDDAALSGNGTVAVWGENSEFGVGHVPLDTTNIVAIAGGEFPTFAVKGDGTVVARGGFSAATNLPPDLTNIVAAAAGDAFGLALTADGEVIGWGDAPPNTGGNVAPFPTSRAVIVSLGGVTNLNISYTVPMPLCQSFRASELALPGPPIQPAKYNRELIF